MTVQQAPRLAGTARLAAGAATGAALLLLATRIGAAEWVPVVAGGLVLAAGFAVMAPCELQMAATLAAVLRNLADGAPAPVRSAAVRFAAGYVGCYVPVAAALAGVAVALGGYAGWLGAVGGIGSLVLGLAALGMLRSGWLARCRGPLWLVRTGRASFHRPLSAGFAFGQYCVSCCGPYLFTLLVLAGATGSVALGGALVLGYAGSMAVPFLVPAVLAPRTYARLATSAQRHVPDVERVTGGMLVVVGALLVPLSLAGMW